MGRQVLLRGGPADGEIIILVSNENIIRVAKIPDAILVSEGSASTADAVYDTHEYVRSISDESIYEFNEY